MSPSSTSTRWCPTPEQLIILEELYRRGVRTPNASQMQKITAYLSYYGKIQGKNVFYWFQNHKARDRQKLRKRLAKQLLQQQHAMQPHLFPLSQTPSYCGAASNELHYFPNPYALYQFSTSFNSAEAIHPQGTGSYAVPGAMMGQNWTVDLPKDCPIRTYGHDFTMVKETGPTVSPCCMNRPLQTLELFPLRSQSDT